MKWSKTGRGANCPFTHFQDVWLRSLTPPTSSKWLSPLEMSCPLKAHEKETSRTGSLTTWQGNTMLSPTMISMSTGPWVILVGSVPRKIKTHIERGSHLRPSELPISHRKCNTSLQQTLTVLPYPKNLVCNTWSHRQSCIIYREGKKKSHESLSWIMW